MKSKSMILYSSRAAFLDRDGKNASRAITVAGETVFVRGEVLEADFETALEKAKPREGETVLNSIPL